MRTVKQCSNIVQHLSALFLNTGTLSKTYLKLAVFSNGRRSDDIYNGLKVCKINSVRG